ncbi:MAG: hypothetical protein IJQ67_00775 [Bacilli bacterium]|nr:hypothetical protein [Methanobrevibacter sp.]MBQ6629737.1 hypothetical protein [Methanobrevibacter sp.]MBR0294424.1 hypothetical protein [Bacilli bacterium]
MKTEQEEMLETLFKKQEGKVIPGTEYWEALVEFSEVCFNQLMSKEKPKVADIHSFIAAAYHYGREQGEKYAKWLQSEIDKLHKED